MEKKILVRIENLSKNFPVKKTKKKLSALHHISLDIRQGEILSLVGESGCGKSTLAKVIVGLLDKDGGEIAFAEKDKNKKWIQMVFQDPYSCLNPKKKIISTLTEVLKVHRIGKAGDRERIVADMLHRCGLNESVFKKYPGELSGGQCQRVSIARALLMKPDLLIADEPISALDVSVQAQIVNMLMDLKDEMDLTILFISHDLEIVRHLSDRIAVMYLGEIVEIADKNELFANPLHPYTKLLLASAPGIESEKKDEIQEKSLTELPNAIDLPPGCRFCSRCTFAGAQCESDPPVLKEIKRGHFVACRICEES